MKLDFKKIDWRIVALILILIFAFFIRIYSLGIPTLWVDEATSSMSSKLILEKGLPIFDSGLLYSRAYLFHYSQAFFFLFGVNDFNARLPSVIFGLLTIILIFFVGNEYSKNCGIISALLTSVFYLEVFFSRQARFYQLFQLLFFSSLYFLYKGKKNKKLFYLSLVLMLLCISVQIEGLVLAPVFIFYILYFYKGKLKYFSIVPMLPLIKKFFGAVGLSSGSAGVFKNYAEDYFLFSMNFLYLLLFSALGLIIGLFKKKELTLLLLIPALATLLGIFTLPVFAFRYAYFFVFLLILYTAVLFSFLIDKYGKLIWISVFLLIIIPSNLFLTYNATNIILPIDNNFNDYSSPYTDYKNVNLNLTEKPMITYFSSDFEWYFKKPDYVLPFSMNGLGHDQISINKSGELVDKYSGAKILIKKPEDGYYLFADGFSVSKLKKDQLEFHDNLTNGCDLIWDEVDLKVWDC